MTAKFPEILPELLASFVAGDPVAKTEVVEIILLPLLRWANTAYPDQRSDELESLMIEIVAEVYERHQLYDPKKSKLTTFIINRFKWRVNDLIKRESKILSLENPFEDEHENQSDEAYNLIDEKDTKIVRYDLIEHILTQLDEQDQAFFQLMRQGHSQTDVFVQVLEKYAPINNAQRDVKNAKERLLRKLKTIVNDQDIKFDDLFD